MSPEAIRDYAIRSLYNDGFSMADISRGLNLSYNTVKHCIHNDKKWRGHE